MRLHSFNRLSVCKFVDRVKAIVGLTISLVLTSACSNLGQLSVEGQSSKQSETGEDLVLYADSSLQTQALKIIETSCLSCHGANSTNSVSNITNVYFLVDSQLVFPGNPNTGRLIGAMEEASMPQGQPALTVQKITTIKDWIASMRWEAPQ